MDSGLRVGDPCRVVDCDKLVETAWLGLCSKHRSRLTVHKTLEPSAVALRRARIATSWARLDTPEAELEGECWPWPGSLAPTGYGQTHRLGESLAHRAAWVHAYGPIPDGLFVCHRCDFRPCFRPSHLFIGTSAENTADRVAKGRTWARDGRRDGRIKLTDEQVVELRGMQGSGLSQMHVARLFGISDSHVAAIWHGKTRTVRTGVIPLFPAVVSTDETEAVA